MDSCSEAAWICSVTFITGFGFIIIVNRCLRLCYTVAFCLTLFSLIPLIYPCMSYISPALASTLCTHGSILVVFLHLDWCTAAQKMEAMKTTSLRSTRRADPQLAFPCGARA